MIKRKLLIYGAGAIGRGYIPWVYTPDEYDYYYIESNSALRDALHHQRHFTSYKTGEDGYSPLHVPILGCLAPGEEVELLQQVDGVVACVGPRNFLGLESVLRGSRVPVICCENDSSLPEIMRQRTGNHNIVFAIPDVITSSTANAELLADDPLSIITEDGICFVDEVAAELPGKCAYVDKQELAKQWAAKLYIHNTPHCIAAYLGSILGVKYLHESMQNASADAIVAGAMREMEQMLRQRYQLDSDFLAFYSNKELSRFRNTLLCDPIARVAREPFRKLAPNERLIGAAQLCLSAGIVPHHLLVGIMAAFCFESSDDPDFHIQFLRRSLQPGEFLRTIIRLRETEALYELLIEHWNDNMQQIEQLKNG